MKIIRAPRREKQNMQKLKCPALDISNFSISTFFSKCKEKFWDFSEKQNT